MGSRARVTLAGIRLRSLVAGLACGGWMSACACAQIFAAVESSPNAAASSKQNRPPDGAEELSGPADKPAPRTDANSRIAHRQLLEKARRGGIDIYFIGDSITRRWGAADPEYKDLLANWTANFHGWNAANFGWGADKIQNMLWRLEDGELAGVNPKIIVVLAGTNNIGKQPGDDEKIEDITRGLKSSRGRVPGESAPRSRHPDRNISAQRQHGCAARDWTNQPEPRTFS